MPFIKRTRSRQAHPSADSRKIFIGRADELHFFVEHVLEPEDPSYNIISISGIGGVGKSTLLARFIDEVHLPRYKDYCLTTIVDDRQSTPESMMERFAHQLNEVGFPLIDFEKTLTRYKEALRKRQTGQEAVQDIPGLRETVDVVGTLVQDVVPGGKLLHGAANKVTELSLKKYASRQFRNDSQLLEDSLGNLTEIFVEELNHLTDTQAILTFNRTKRQQRILLFFDTFEQLAPQAAPWLLDHFLPANINSNIVLVIAGRDPIERSTPDDPKRWLPYFDHQTIYAINLDSFTEDETRAYLAGRGISDPARSAMIWQLSGGLPLYLSLLTFNPQGNVDPTADVVANFLRWIPEQEKVKRRLALDAALFSKPFNQDDLEAFSYVSESDRSVLFQWLIGLPFVRMSTQDTRYSYHDVAQALFSRHLYQRSRKEYYTSRKGLANYYQSLLENFSTEDGRDVNSSAEWLEVVMALVYQLFLLPNDTDHRDAIKHVLHAYESTEQVGEIVRVLRKFSQEQIYRQISPNAEQVVKLLLKYIEADRLPQKQELLIAANALLQYVGHSSSFPAELLASIYRKRGSACRTPGTYKEALQDYNHALELNPNYTRAYASRGDTYRLLGAFEQAFQDYNRAIELDSHYARGYASRATIYRLRGTYEQALQDYSRALELDPNDAVNYARRGLTHLWLRNIEQAQADYSRGWELDPTFLFSKWMAEWSSMCQKGNDPEMVKRLEAIAATHQQHDIAYVCRGVALGLSGHFAMALIPLEQAISLDRNGWSAYFWKSLIYASLRQHEEALTALNKALALNLPPVLLAPLRWLEQERSDFYEKYVVPLLAHHNV